MENFKEVLIEALAMIAYGFFLFSLLAVTVGDGVVMGIILATYFWLNSQKWWDDAVEAIAST